MISVELARLCDGSWTASVLELNIASRARTKNRAVTLLKTAVESKRFLHAVRENNTAVINEENALLCNPQEESEKLFLLPKAGYYSWNVSPQRPILNDV